MGDHILICLRTIHIFFSNEVSLVHFSIELCIFFLLISRISLYLGNGLFLWFTQLFSLVCCIFFNFVVFKGRNCLLYLFKCTFLNIWILNFKSSLMFSGHQEFIKRSPTFSFSILMVLLFCV